MKTVGALLQAHQAQASTTLCLCLKLTRVDGDVYGFTEHDKELSIGGVTYQPIDSIALSAITTTSSLAVDTLEITGAINSTFTVESIRGGVWDYCDARVFEVNWSDLTQGTSKHRRGFLGDIEVMGLSLRAEIRSLTQLLQTARGKTCSKFCIHDLFDARCMVPETENTWKFSNKAVTSVTSRRVFEFASLNQAADFFGNGKLLGITGANEGFTREISDHTIGSPASAILTLYEEMPFTVTIGDTFTVWAGCRKRYAEDCIAKFANGINHGGFPYLPGPDSAFESP